MSTDLPKDEPKSGIKTSSGGETNGEKFNPESSGTRGAKLSMKMFKFTCTYCDCGFDIDDTDGIVHHLISHAVDDNSTNCALCKLKCASMPELRNHLLWHVGLPQFTSIYNAGIRIGAVPHCIEKRFEGGQVFGVDPGLQLPAGYHYIENGVYYAQSTSTVDDTKPSSSTKLGDPVVGSKVDSPLPHKVPTPKDSDVSSPVTTATNSMSSGKKLVEVDGPARRCPLRTVCSASFQNSKLLLDHLMSLDHCPDTVLVCPICKKTMNRSRDLRWHIALHLRYKRYLCGTCNQTFTTVVNFNAHMC